jgi:hypothetical protein
MKYRSAIMLASLVACSLGVISNAAAAINNKTYPGLGCVPDPGTSGTPALFMSSIFNDSTTDTLNVHCPFVRDDNNINSGLLKAFDRNPAAVNGDVSCTIVFGGWGTDTASSAFLSTSAVTSGSATGLQTIQFGAIQVPTFGGSYYAACTIPPKTASGASHITFFTVGEVI